MLSPKHEAICLDGGNHNSPPSEGDAALRGCDLGRNPQLEPIARRVQPERFLFTAIPDQCEDRPSSVALQPARAHDQRTLRGFAQNMRAQLISATAENDRSRLTRCETERRAAREHRHRLGVKDLRTDRVDLGPGRPPALSSAQNASYQMPRFQVDPTIRRSHGNGTSRASLPPRSAASLPGGWAWDTTSAHPLGSAAHAAFGARYAKRSCPDSAPDNHNRLCGTPEVSAAPSGSGRASASPESRP